jgi:hypothetical protein
MKKPRSGHRPVRGFFELEDSPDYGSVGDPPFLIAWHMSLHSFIVGTQVVCLQFVMQALVHVVSLLHSA